jgi:hypothetical protein
MTEEQQEPTAPKKLDPLLWQDFKHFHADNPHVWPLFVRFAFEAIKAGRQRFSARTIIHRIRWFTSVETTTADEDFKINNNWSPYYARVFMRIYPEHEGFFETRAVDENPTIEAELVRAMRNPNAGTVPRRAPPRPKAEELKQALAELAKLNTKEQFPPPLRTVARWLWWMERRASGKVR